ncbi:MAG TPA: hypothetical protein VF234_04570, partial [Limnochordia bacterium]
MPSATDERELIAWDFRAGPAGWRANADVVDLSTGGGALEGRSEGADPILYSPEFELSASPLQVVEIRMRSDAAGEAEIFWANTHAPPFNGFRPAQRAAFAVEAGDEFRTYRILPFWHAQQKIIKIRIDPPSGAHWAIASVRILQPEHSAIVADPTLLEASAWTTGLIDGSLVWISPPLSLDAAAVERIELRARARTSPRAMLYWVAESRNGAPGPLQRSAFRLEPDGRERPYLVDLAGRDGWTGRIVALAVGFFDDPQAELLSVRGLGAPTAPELEVARLHLRDAVNRAGRPATLVAVVRNRGSETDGPIRARGVMGGIALAEQASPAGETLSRGEEVTFSWPVTVPRPGDYPVRLEVSTAGTPPVVATGRVSFTAPVSAEPARLSDGRPYVPAPRPVRGAIDVGVYYFPGWESYTKW